MTAPSARRPQESARPTLRVAAPDQATSHEFVPALYHDKSFWGMAATQFLGAFNDNLFKQLILLLATPTLLEVKAATGSICNRERNTLSRPLSCCSPVSPGIYRTDTASAASWSSAKWPRY